MPACYSDCIIPDGLLGTLKSQCQQLGGNLPKSQWCCIPNYNVKSIGIELVNLGDLCNGDIYKNSVYCDNFTVAYGMKWQNFTQAQMNSLVNLVSDIAARYNIPLDRNHIVGHYQITTNKTDPGPIFPWNKFMQKLNKRGAVALSVTPKNNGERERSFYVTDRNGSQYIVTVLALIGKDEKNIAK